MDDLIGKNLGRYHIVEQLGEGGMASVYKAFDTLLERNVAVKVIRVEKGKDPSFHKRFEREAKALAKLSHPNIVHVDDYGEQDGMPYLVMDFVPGGTLKNRLNQPVPYQDAAKILIPVARALQHAHENGIVHRDVKPANILITSGGDPMLSDFGISKLLESEQSMELTGTGVGIGTPEYMAPEQSTGTHVDKRADIYSLGVVLYELVTGRKPFKADTPMAVLIKHINDPLPRPGSFMPGLPEEVDQVIYKAMAKKLEDRYQSMEEFAKALERLVTVPPSAQPSTYQGETVAVQKLPPTQVTVPLEPAKKAGGLPLKGPLVGVAVALIIILLLVVCGIVGYSVYSSSIAKALPTATQLIIAEQTQATATITVQANQATPTIEQDTPVPTAAAPTTTPEPSKTSGPVTISNPDFTQVILTQQQGSLAAGESRDLGEYDIPRGMDMVMVQLSWKQGTLEGVVLKPDGSRVNESDPNVQVMKSDTMLGYTVMENPPAGKWKVSIKNISTSGEPVTYNFSMTYMDQKN